MQREKIMKKIRSIVALTLAFTCTISSIYSQDPYQEDYSSAYVESSHTAHWPAYIPITLLVAAAIWFGAADQHHERHHSSNSQDGLGSIASSKRISRSSNSYRSSRSSHGSFSH